MLVNITASKSLKMAEVRDAVKTVQAFAAPEAFVKYGTVFDDTMEDRIRITVVATGLGAPRAARQHLPAVPAGPAAQVENGLVRLDVQCVQHLGQCPGVQHHTAAAQIQHAKEST